MHSGSCREDFTEVFDGFDALMDRALALDAEVLTTAECLAMLEHWEVLHRRFSAVGHPMINQLAAYADEAELGGKLVSALANRLHVTRTEASRRIGDAADLGPRRALTGEPLPPVLPATAQAQRDGLIGDTHVRVIRGFWQHLPEDVDVETRVKAEAHLAALGPSIAPTNWASSPTGWLIV